MPVAQKITSLLRTRSSSSSTRSRSPKPISIARCASCSLRGWSRPMKFPPRHLIAAAASTPSGAPPVPIAT